MFRVFRSKQRQVAEDCSPRPSALVPTENELTLIRLLAESVSLLESTTRFLETYENRSGIEGAVVQKPLLEQVNLFTQQIYEMGIAKKKKIKRQLTMF